MGSLPASNSFPVFLPSEMGWPVGIEYVLLPGTGHTSGGVYGERKRRDFFIKNLLGLDPPDWNMLEK